MPPPRTKISGNNTVFVANGTPYYHVCDRRGSVRQLLNGTSGQVERQYHYYLYGALFWECAATVLQGSGAHSRHRFEGKEQVSCGDMSFLDYPARPYDPLLLQFWTDDPLCEKYPRFGPRLYCMGDPVNTSDPTGCDTVKINFLNNKWTITETVLSKDNDVFIVTKDGSSKTYSFTEGEYGNRVLALNLYDDGEGSYNLGVYHVSGEQENGTGFYVTPGGLPSSKDGSGKRIPDGYYPLTTPIEANEWRTPGVGGAVGLRGVRFHYGGNNPLSWTKGCFILSYDYDIINGSVLYNKQTSKTASINFNKALGANEIIEYKFKKRKEPRIGATFKRPITHSLILMSR